ncbi:MAG: PDZ domain-containing protein [Isosphaeraceae bacterium]|nr:PDZ domain-containing protein [Isosphaeraceae bacterium]
MLDRLRLALGCVALSGLFAGSTCVAQFDRPDLRFRPPLTYDLGVRERAGDTGVVIMDVTPYSPASQIGIERGDTIVTVDGRQVGRVDRRVVDLDELLDNTLKRERRALLLILNGRNGRLINVEVRADQFEGGFNPNPGPGPGPNPGPGPWPGMGGAGSQIRKWYLQFLKREITRQEMQTWEAHIRQGKPIEQIQDLILASGEYYQICGGDEAKFIGGLFRDVLRRSPVSPEGANWLARLKQLKGDRYKLAESFRTSYAVPFP